MMIYIFSFFFINLLLLLSLHNILNILILINNIFNINKITLNFLFIIKIYYIINTLFIKLSSRIYNIRFFRFHAHLASLLINIIININTYNYFLKKYNIIFYKF